jgi:hypothetical protein
VKVGIGVRLGLPLVFYVRVCIVLHSVNILVNQLFQSVDYSINLLINNMNRLSIALTVNYLHFQLLIALINRRMVLD